MNENLRWGISTGLAFQGKSLSDATIDIIELGGSVVELCPNGQKITADEIKYLTYLKQNGGIDFTVHTSDTLRIDSQSPDYGLSKHFDKNLGAYSLANEVGALWLIQHPPIYDPQNPLSNQLVAEYLELVGENIGENMKVAFETGVYRRKAPHLPPFEVEDGRTPKQLSRYVNHPQVSGVVGDVSKMSRFNEPYHPGKHSMKSIERYFSDGLNHHGIIFKEFQIIGQDYWKEDMDFAKRTLSLIARYNLLDYVIVIESTPTRLPVALKVVEGFIANQQAA